MIQWRRGWQTASAFLPWEPHKQYEKGKRYDTDRWNPQVGSVQFSSFQSLSRIRLFAAPWTAAYQASLSITNSWSLPKLMSIESVMPSNHLILCHPLLLLPLILPSIRVLDVQYTTGEEWRNRSRRNEEVELKQKWHPVVEVCGGENKVQWCKEQYCIGTLNVVRSVNQGKLGVVKQEMARVNIDILGISELKWPGMSEFNSDDHYIYYCEQDSLRRNGIAPIVNERVRNAVLSTWVQSQKWQNDLGLFPRQTYITVIQVYAPTIKAKEVEVEEFYEDLQDLLELTSKKDVLYHQRGLECKSRNSRDS